MACLVDVLKECCTFSYLVRCVYSCLRKLVYHIGFSSLLACVQCFCYTVVSLYRIYLYFSWCL
jgi:hypothetical protein